MQVIFCTDIPSQKAPPLRGAGLVQVRERFCHPLPQGTLQADHSVQEDQPPFTEREKWGGEKKKKKGKRFLLIAYYVQATCQVLWVGHPGTKRPVGTLTGCPTVWQLWGWSSLHLPVYSSVDHRRDTETLLCKEMMNQRKKSSTYLYSTCNSRGEEENTSIWISINFQCFKRQSQGSSTVEGSAFFNSWEFHLSITWAIQQIVMFVFGGFHMPEEELRIAKSGDDGVDVGFGKSGKQKLLTWILFKCKHNGGKEASFKVLLKIDWKCHSLSPGSLILDERANTFTAIGVTYQWAEAGDGAVMETRWSPFSARHRKF